MRAYIAVRLTKVARDLGINQEEAEKCVAITEAENTNKLLLDKNLKGKIGLPVRNRPFFFEIRPEWMGEWYGGHPSVRWSCMNEIHINPSTGCPQFIRGDLLDKSKRILDDAPGVVRTDDQPWMENTFLRIMLGRENYVKPEDRFDPKTGGLKGNLKQFTKGLHRELLRMIVEDEADVYFIPLRAPVGSDPRPCLDTVRDKDGKATDQPWWDELIFRMDILAENLANPRLSNRPNASYASPWGPKSAPESQEGVEDGPADAEEEFVGSRYRGPAKPNMAMTGEMIEVEAKAETTQMAMGHIRVPQASGLMIGQFRKNGKHCFAFMHVEAGKRFVGSCKRDRCHSSFVDRAGGALHLPERFIPKEMMKLLKGETKEKIETKPVVVEKKPESGTGGGSGNGKTDEKAPLTHSLAGKLQAALSGSKPASNPPAAS
jgi:hypothetical protein